MEKKEKNASASFEIERLLRSAFTRTKNRFVSYILTMVLFWLISIASFAVFIILALIIALILSMIKITAVTIVVAGIGILAAYILCVYISAWGHLAMVQVLIENITAMEALKKVKPLIWGYFIYTFFLGLFILGLAPFGILSLGIIFVLWGVWNMFGVFVYLDYKKVGLQNLWHSRALVNSQFWGVVLRLGIVYVAFYMIIFLFAMTGKDNGLAKTVIVLLSFFSAPFITSYLYEMYITLKTDVKVAASKVWVGLSILGGILMILGVIALTNVAITQGPALMKVIQKDLKNNKYEVPNNKMNVPTIMQNKY